MDEGDGNAMEPLKLDRGIAFIDLLVKCHRYDRDIAASLDISVDELHCLSRIYSARPYCVKELSSLLGMKPSRTSIILRDLEKRGYLTRSLSLTDKRMEQLSLTEDGIRAAEKVLNIAAEAGEKFLTSMPTELAGSFAKSSVVRKPVVEQKDWTAH
jgi:DNA-binding MarR family transcriptional regulator